jgi:hypothetical protein
MTTAIAVAAVLAFSFALGSLIRLVDGATLRRWRLSRRWDVSRLAREFIKAADEPLATLRGLTHMINAWERGVRRPSERYWLLYLQIFPEWANGETVLGDEKLAVALAEEQPRAAEVNATEVPDFGSARSADPGDLRALAASVKALEQQIAGISRRLDELSSDEDGEAQPREKSQSPRMRSSHQRSSWMPLWTILVPALQP